MMTDTRVNMSRETALRIALAARALPDVSVGQLLEVLYDQVSGELSEESLRTVTVTALKNGFAGEDGDASDIGMAAMKDAVRILWGEGVSQDLPTPVKLDSLPPRSVRVAVASNSGELLDGHFGSCLRFLIYQVSAEEKALIDVRSVLEADLAEDRNAYRAELIGDCQVLYVVSIGGPAAAKVVRANVYPIKKADGGSAEDVLAELQRVMASAPPPWLAKLLGVDAEQRVRFALSDEASST